MSVLDELEQATAEERQAMLRGDWRALQRCVDRKQALADGVPTLPAGDADPAQARRLREATRANQELAVALSGHLSELIALGQQRSTYNHRGRLGRAAQPIMRLQG